MDERVRMLIEEPLKDINIKLCDVEYVKEGGTYFLRVIIDKEPFVDVDTCVEVTNVINPLLDDIDFIDDSYILDITTKEKGGSYE